jgi:uncharacterized cupredoxin-like copper-binding protein
VTGRPSHRELVQALTPPADMSGTEPPERSWGANGRRRRADAARKEEEAQEEALPRRQAHRADHWQLQLSRGALLSGTVEVEFNNRYAEDPHDLWISRAGTTYRFELVDNGEKATRHVVLSAGTWRLWCDLPGHVERGMQAYVTVADG